MFIGVNTDGITYVTQSNSTLSADCRWFYHNDKFIYDVDTKGHRTFVSTTMLL